MLVGTVILPVSVLLPVILIFFSIGSSEKG